MTPSAPPTASAQPDRSTLASVRNAARVLRAFSRAGQELGITELSRQLGLGKSTVHRLVTTLTAERGAAEEEVWQEYVAQNSLGRLPTADELAWAVEVLLDPEADLLHGSVLYLDAGGHRGIH